MKKVLFMLLVMFALSACQSKDSYVKEFSDFVDKVEMEAADYTDKDRKLLCDDWRFYAFL